MTADGWLAIVILFGVLPAAAIFSIRYRRK